MCKESSENQFTYILIAVLLWCIIMYFNFKLILIGWAILWAIMSVPFYGLLALALFCTIFHDNIPTQKEE
jgi:hypothetical protein